MIPIESQATAEVMFWFAIGAIAFILVVAFFDWLGGKLLDATLSSQEERDQREAERIKKELERQAKEIHRKQMRSVRFWNF